MIARKELLVQICEDLQNEYIALLGQRGSGISTFKTSLLNESTPISGMHFISISLPQGPQNEDEFLMLFLDKLKTAITHVPPEVTLKNAVLQELDKHERAGRSIGFQLRMALNMVGTTTTANPLVIVLQSLAEAPEGPLRNFLLLLRDYHKEIGNPTQPGGKLRFLAVGDILLWLLSWRRLDDELLYPFPLAVANNVSPFSIAKRVFLDDLSYNELINLDASGSFEAAIRMRTLTGGVPALIQKAIELKGVSDDLSPFFALLQKYWDSLPQASKQALKQFATDPSVIPHFIVDHECPQLPRIGPPWMEAFWKGFLRVQQRELTWRSPIHRAFVMERTQNPGNIKKAILIKVDLLEQVLRLEKALKQEPDNSGRGYLEDAFLLSAQIPGSLLSPLLKNARFDGNERTILQAISQLGESSDKGWIKELETKFQGQKEPLNNLLIDAAIWENRRLLGDFDVFLCHNNADKREVKEVAEKLLPHSILPWLDEWELRPGLPWIPELEQQIGHVKAAAVFVGSSGIGPWQQEELNSLLNEFHTRKCVVIPVILPTAPQGLELPKNIEVPLFLRNRTWVNFQKDNPDPIDQLVWGITGRREHGKAH